MIDKKTDYENLEPQNFEFVQRDEKIFDKKFDTKPIGYFKDALIRFRKNRTNVIATVILFALIILSIFVPILTSKNYTELETQLQYLPPRVPYLEKIGILDGTREYTEQLVDRDTIDPETGLGLPLRFNPDFIIPNTLKNNTKTCTNRVEGCVGGQSVLVLEKTPSSAFILSNDSFSFSHDKNPILSINVDSFIADYPTLIVFLSKDNGENYEAIGSITRAGIHEFNVFNALSINADFDSKIKLEFFELAMDSELSMDNKKEASVILTSIEIFDNTQETPVVSETGTKLSLYKLNDGNIARYVRQNGELLQASFRYDEYQDAFYEREEFAFSANTYDELIKEYSDVCVKSPDPYNPQGWTFPEGCPIKKVIGESERLLGPDGKYHFSYHLILDYKLYKGDDNIPYFFFGTNASGHDYFALIWLGLRTSLFIGFIVAIINISIGVVYGAIEGYYGGKVDLLMERFAEIIGRIPWLVWLGLFVIVIGPGIVTLIVLMTITGWLGIAGITRSQFYRFKGREYVLASRTLGAKDSRLIFRHILPNGIGTIITASVLMIPGVIFTESTVSYLGYGIGYGQSFKILGLFDLSGVSIGVLLAEGRGQMFERPYLTMFPALIISILMITFNMFGNALRDAFNPSLRGSE